MVVPAGARVVDDPTELQAFFSDAPSVHIYALADLEPPFWAPSTWYRRDDAVVGLVQMPGNSATTVYAVATRDPAGTLSLLVELLPVVEPGTLITAPVGLEAVLLPHFDIAWSGPHLRYHLADADVPPETEANVKVEPLHRDRLPDLLALYGSDPGAAFFLPPMIDDGCFVGIYKGGQLVAAAGTHVLSVDQRCAAIGSVYTRPAYRGQGLARLVTAGVMARLRGQVDVIGLNVAASNAAARSVYEGLGFRPILEYAEAEVGKRR